MIESFEVIYNHIAAAYQQAVVITAVYWENVASHSNQVTVIVSTTKHQP